MKALKVRDFVVLTGIDWAISFNIWNHGCTGSRWL